MRHFSEIARFVDDVPATVRFYRDVLQAAPVHETSGLAIFHVGGLTLLLHQRYEPGPDDLPPEDHVAVAVEDFEAAVEDLLQKGHAMEVPPREFPWGRSAYLRDPAGHLVELHVPG
jgi:catechol 2,3-dioxygenase-like lactoylglutathione lyase family enzyme